jgi:hypothetical protein
MPWQNTIVMTAVTIDKAGPIVLPKPNGAVAVESGRCPGGGQFRETSYPAPGAGKFLHLQEAVGLGHAPVAPLSEDRVEKTMHQIRREREQSFLGKQK